MSATATTEYFEFPVSATQATFWYMYQLDQSSTAYTIPLAFSIRGQVDSELIRKSMQSVMNRHEILRTTYCEKTDGTLVQRILPESDLPFEFIEVEGSDESHRQERLSELLEKEYRRPVRIDSEPVLRARLYQLTSDEHVLLLVGHHIAFDHFAFGLFLEEMATHYRLFANNEESTLGEPELQYADYVVWKQEQLEAASSSSGKKAWKERLKDFSGVLNLSTTFPRPKFQTFDGRDRYFRFDRNLSSRLREFGRSRGYSTFNVTLACLKSVYQRYSRQDDIVIGTPFSDRNQGEELEKVLGCFVNTLPLATRFAEGMTFLDLLESTKSVMSEAYANQLVPLEDIIKELGTQRDLSRNPLFQVGFVFQDPPMSFSLPDAKISPMEIANFGAMYDLHTFMWDDGETIGGLLAYNTNLFDDVFVSRFIETFESAASQLVSNPDHAIRGLPFLSDSDREQLSQVNETRRNFDSNATVLSLFSQQVLETPSRPAVVGIDSELSYSELESRSSAFAGYLADRGISPGIFVGISVERSADMLVALLGIWKAGAAYVPLDPAYPADRLQYMMETASISALVTQDALAQKIPLFDCPRVLIDADRETWMNHAPINDVVSQHGDDLAYVIFTSGSTGKPKGVQIRHRSVANLVQSMFEVPGIGEDDRLLAVVTLSFDMSVPELFLPVCAGSTVVIATSDQASDGRELLRLVEDHKITFMNATPATYRLMIDEGWMADGDWSDFTAICAGEAFPPDLAKAMAEGLGNVWNMYGPTETTVYSTAHRIDPQNFNTRIGRPIQNTGVHILNESGMPVPVGVPGVLHISGDGLSCGYLNAEELTSQSFYPHPGDEALQIYSTGDLVVLYDDSELDYLHRLDGQVKLRGYRIELGEIESVLSEEESVSKVVAHVWSAGVDDQRLVAYIIPAAGKISAIKLRKVLRTRLPDFMIPQHFVEVAEFPLTANGKIDRKSLPSPLGLNSTKQKDLPSTALEKSVAAIWSTVLGEGQVYRDDNFFDIGGHSLLAVKVISVMEKEHGVRLNPRMIVMQSLAEIAADLSSKN